ncbi:hypothetical protein VFPPC_04897 [Pochonia chlamydosporia 170]|uniref:Uncharacterized protein n=1 Tax=Pochonia chlamydosporia 170 TaxID=1380566 RepID=A0A179FU95_METCM|nr:hypothetical protein VFPPC_04897 [Pochonia chlamydosporia 170]OAQ68691.1 hypothetical protein VFPPC_04897 [Pochonia chlamydosporia 170]
MAPISSLPPQILEDICKLLASPPPDRNSDGTKRSRRPYTKDCGSMRLTCKAFRDLSDLRLALFYDILVEPTRQSIANLDLIARHPVIRNCVRRLTFNRPVVPPRQVLASTAFSNDSEGILSYGEVAASCALSISRLPNLFSVVVSNTDMFNPEYDYDFHDRSIRIQEGLHETTSKNRSEPSYGDYVLSALAGVEDRIEELNSDLQWAPTWKLSPEPIFAHRSRPYFTRLTQLVLHLRDESNIPEGSDWSDILHPLIKDSSRLEELCLHFRGDDKLPERYPVINQLWDMEIPQLTVLSIRHCRLSSSAFSGFLSRQSSLRHLSLDKVEADAGWDVILTCTQEHPKLGRMKPEYNGVDGKPSSFTIYSLSAPNEQT